MCDSFRYANPHCIASLFVAAIGFGTILVGTILVSIVAVVAVVIVVVVVVGAGFLVVLVAHATIKIHFV
jgi:hypothetical protein